MLNAFVWMCPVSVSFHLLGRPCALSRPGSTVSGHRAAPWVSCDAVVCTASQTCARIRSGVLCKHQ